MKKIIKISFFVSVLILVVMVAANTYRQMRVSDTTEEIKTEHFRVVYKGILDKEASSISFGLESRYDKLTSLFGIENLPLISVYVHPTQDDFDNVTGWRGAAGTVAGPETIHLSWPRLDNTTAIHEFVHILQLNLLINYGIDAGWSDEKIESEFSENYPRWLWESVSIYFAGERSKLGILYHMREGHRPRLKSFTRKNNKIYFVGYTIAEHIVETWGEKELIDLVRAFGDVESTLNVSEKELERGWHSFVSSRYITL